MTKEQMLTLLKKDVVPALGCTEPVCVALCAATAATVLEGPVEQISVEVNPGIYKNAMSAGIPGCSKVGLPWAAAIGANLKNPEKSLQLLEDITETTLSASEALINAHSVSVSVKNDEKSIYVKCILRSAQEEVICITRNSHTNIVFLAKNGSVLMEKESTATASGEDPLVEELKSMTVAQIRELVCSASEEELAFMLDGIEMNESLAAYSENHDIGIGLAATLRSQTSTSLFSNDLIGRITLAVTAAAENRLDGCPYPTMSSSGAGTKGLVVILPIAETAKMIHATRLQTVQALALGHLTNRYINAYVGKLSPMCSCVMCSSTAAAVGIAFLLGADDTQIGWTIRNMSGTVTGMICDGGKVGCAMKVATGSFAAVMSALQAVNGVALRTTDGICAETPEQCIKNMASVGINGMKDTDQEILRIMTQCK